MEELWQLRSLIEHEQYDDALILVGEMEEMSRDDKITKIESFLEILLLHLIKKHAEQRFTRSWQHSILNTVDTIKRLNKRRKAGGWYLTADELQEATEEIWMSTLRKASYEAFEGQYDVHELSRMVHKDQVIAEALELITQENPDQ